MRCIGSAISCYALTQVCSCLLAVHGVGAVSEFGESHDSGPRKLMRKEHSRTAIEANLVDNDDSVDNQHGDVDESASDTILDEVKIPVPFEKVQTPDSAIDDDDDDANSANDLALRQHAGTKRKWDPVDAYRRRRRSTTVAPSSWGIWGSVKGTDSGTLFSVMCPVGTWITQITMRAGTKIDRLGPVTCSDRSIVDKVYGGATGTKNDVENDNGFTGYSLHHGSHVNSLCLNQDGSLECHGSKDSGSEYKFTCPGKSLLAGFEGKAGTAVTPSTGHINRIRFVCGCPDGTILGTSSPTSGALCLATPDTTAS